MLASFQLMILNLNSIGHTEKDVDVEWQEEITELLNKLVYHKQQKHK